LRWIEAKATRTLLQSHSSSSVKVIAACVIAPLPISGWGTRMVMVPSVAISTHGENSMPAAASGRHGPAAAVRGRAAAVEPIPSAMPPK
jgi:hypothetical protein